MPGDGDREEEEYEEDPDTEGNFMQGVFRWMPEPLFCD